MVLGGFFVGVLGRRVLKVILEFKRSVGGRSFFIGWFCFDLGGGRLVYTSFYLLGFCSYSG